MVTTIRRTISPAVKAIPPLATCTGLGRKGAPAAKPTRITPICSPPESGMILTITSARIGTRTKLARRDMTTSLRFRSGAMI